MLPILSGNVASAIGGAYEVANSCRFNRGDSPGLTLTQSSPTDNNKWTFSCWFKVGALTTAEGWLFLAYSNSTNMTALRLNGSGDSHTLNFWDYQSSYTGRLVTNRSFRDPSAWYHVVCVWDSDNGTAGNRMRMYVNGTEETSFSTDTNPSSGQSTIMNTSSQGLEIGRSNAESAYFDGYMAEVCFVDGQALAASDFGEFDSDSPTIWKPKDVSGLTFGNNGFYLDFEDSGDLGDDESGNTNDFTEVNLAATDSSTDSPTNNFCVMNPLDNYIPASTFSEGNCKVVTQSTGYQYNTATFGLTAGKWYYEMKLISKTGAEIVGIAGRVCGNSLHYLGYYNDGWGYHSYDGKYKNNNTGTSYGDTWDADDTVVGVFIDLDNNKLYFAKNGTIQNSGTGISITDPASVNDGVYYPAVGDNWNGGAGTYEINFGNPTWSLSSAVADANGYGSFEYDPSDGGSSSFDSAAKDFLAICTKNLGSDGG
jgi:hypothetical protein